MIIAATYGIFINSMKANRNTITIIALGAFLVGVLVFWKLFLAKKPTEKQPVVSTPTPTITYRPILPSPVLKITPKEKTIKLLPITTENYTVEYLPKINKFFVLIFGKPFEKYKTEVEEWFYSQGIENLKQLDISWGVPREGIPP